jgi:hypothetical protein
MLTSIQSTSRRTTLIGHSSGSSLIRSILQLSSSALSPESYGNVVLLSDPMFYPEQSASFSESVATKVWEQLCRYSNCQLTDEGILSVQEKILDSNLIHQWTYGEIPIALPFGPKINSNLEHSFFESLSFPNSSLSTTIRNKRLWVNFLSHEVAPSVASAIPSSSLRKSDLYDFLKSQIGDERAIQVTDMMNILFENNFQGDEIRETLTMLGTGMIFSCPAISLLSSSIRKHVTVSQLTLPTTSPRYSTNELFSFCQGKSCHSDELSSLFNIVAEDPWDQELKNFVWGEIKDGSGRVFADEQMKVLDAEEMSDIWGCGR